MKILFTDATLLHGGAERVISILANALIELGHEVEILLYYDQPVWYELNERIIVSSDEQVIGSANVLKHIQYRHKFYKESNADIIISFLAPVNMVNIVAKAFTGKKLIVADRNDPRKTPVNFIMRKVRDFLYRFADGIILQSLNNKAYFSKAVQGKSKVIFNPVNVGCYNRAAIKAEKKDEIIAVGRLIEQKNPFMLLEAFSEISKKYPTYTLTYYGEGNLFFSLKERAKQLGIAEKVNLPGAVKDVFERMKSSKIYAMTSQYEGMPNALIEAMCIGIPVISTKVSGAVDLIEDKKNGRLVDCDDEKGLKNVLLEMIENYGEAEKLALNAVHLNEELETKQIVANWLNYIEEVLSV